MTNGNDSIQTFEYTISNEFGTNGTAWNIGLTKREYFAAMAMQGILANNEEGNTQWDYAVIGKHSVLAADAFIEQLNK